MAEEPIAAAGEEGGPPPWRALWVSAAALLATLALIGLIFMITWSNRARDEALGWERRTYEVMLLTRTIDATIARSEAALGRYVLDEDQNTGTAYYNDWRTAGWHISQLQRRLRDDPEQVRRVADLLTLFERRNLEISPAASAAERREGSGGLNILYQAAQSATLPALRAQLEAIARAERDNLARRARATQIFVARTDAFTEWLGWLAILIGIGAIGLAVLAYRAFVEGRKARREADSEAWRALELERAVQERTRELSDANERLKAEATERASAEAQLRQVQKMEAVGQLTGGIAHDFNNMLAVVVGGLDLARRRLHGPRREVEFHLDNAMEGATRAAALTRRLLAFARAEPLLPEAMIPSERVESMLDLVDRALGERITIHTRFPETPWHVWADSTQLENALLNLAVNARDAMHGSGELMIDVDNVVLADEEIDDLPAGDYVKIAVADTGSGIPPEHLERVFEPFFTTKPMGKGTGLGLTQIFGFARQSGGHARIASTLGEGTTVTLYLPRYIVAEPAKPAQAAAAPVAETRTVHPGAVILVVEDDPRVSRSTMGALEELGYRPLAVPGGREALETLETHPEIDLVVTDVMMPEMTGTELAAALRRLHPHVPIVFVTGYVGEAGEAEELVGGELLRKPFTVAALARAVESALGAQGRVSGSHLASTGEAAE
ncbi:ATP-binding protein [Sphingosinicella sp. CPCC 101087]|uniref:ATP-binding protein n=1 Tax=Sphingosinicella sp. CPCC 101087 TaxID=2497754 RepID=UPI00101B6F48|nr:ATP-binding protein [Sphingosinicella sp. CPCC 101087]